MPPHRQRPRRTPLTDTRGSPRSGDAAPFGEILRRYRERAHFSQEELAERAGVSGGAISALERGVRQQPHPGTLRRLADALGLSEGDRSVFLERRPSATPAAEAKPAVPGLLQFPAPGQPRHDEGRAAAATPRHNLPLETTSFVGRQEVLAEVIDQFAGTPTGPRLLTLIGAGGCGKTRLALRAAADLLGRYRDGAWLVELAPVDEPELVVSAAATVLGVRGGSEPSLLESLLVFLRPRRVVLVLDNCEQVIGAAASLAAAILRSCPDVRILATSREPLRIDGEISLRVPSLALPTNVEKTSRAELAAVESIELFIERARSVQPGFALNDQNAPYVAEICRRLDGIPLAIELAAMRVKLLSVEQIARRLDQRFTLLTTGNRAALPRQQTLAATVAWSYDLLSEPEQRLFEALSVFAGGFSLEAVEAVGGEIPPLLAHQERGRGGEVRPPTPVPTVLSLLGELVDKSLVVAEPTGDGGPRYYLLETLRQYAWEKLVLRGEAAAAQRRHAAYYGQLVHALAEARFKAGAEAPYFKAIAREVANVRAMLGWYLEQPIDRESFRALAHTLDYWGLMTSRAEAQAWALRFLAAAEQQRVDPLLHSQMLLRCAQIDVDFGALDLAHDRLLRAIALARLTEFTEEIAQALTALGLVQLERGQFVEAEAALREGLLVAQRERFVAEIKRAYILLGDLARRRRDLAAARAFYEEVFRVELHLFQNWAWRGVAWAALREGDLATVVASLKTSIELYRPSHHVQGLVACLTVFAALNVARGNLLHAAEVVGSIEAGLQELGGQLNFSDRFEHEQTIETLSARLPAEDLVMAQERGRAKSVEVAVAEALRDLTDGTEP